MRSLASNSVTSGSPSRIPHCNVTRAPPASRWARTARAEPDQPHRTPTSVRARRCRGLADDRLRGALRHVVAKRERIIADGFRVEVGPPHEHAYQGVIEKPIKEGGQVTAASRTAQSRWSPKWPLLPETSLPSSPATVLRPC